MTFHPVRSTVFGFNEEATDGTLVEPAAADFTTVREGFTFQGSFETLESDELVDSLAAGTIFTTKETPTGSISKYLKHSGTEGTAPDYAVFLKSALGSQTVNSTEYDTVNGSSAGSSAARGYIILNSGEAANFATGQAFLIKDNANGYSIRNYYSNSTGDQVELNFNLASAPASGVNTGKCIAFAPTNSGHPSFSAFQYQDKTTADNAFTQAMAGCRTTNTTINIAANGLAEISFDFAGTAFYFNPIEITSSNKYIDITDDASTLAVQVTEKWYRNPRELARAITEAATQASADAGNSNTITCSFDPTDGKFTLESDGSTFSLLWNSGSNAANDMGSALGFATAADDTGATSYEGDNALTYSVDATPSYDDNDPYVCKDQELLIGDYFRTDHRKCGNVSFTASTPKTDIADIGSQSGVCGSVPASRATTFSATLWLEKHEIEEMDDFQFNNDTQVMYNGGEKVGGNWSAGKCFNVWLPLVNLSATLVGETDGLYAFQVEGRAKANSTYEDVYINFL